MNAAAARHGTTADEFHPSTYTGPIPSHPAKWTPTILEQVAAIVGAMTEGDPTLFGPVRVLDPCAGVGGIHALADRWPDKVVTVGVDIQPEWAAADARTLVGDSTHLPGSWAGTFDVVASSFTYPNRMTDHHEARDPCSTCKGSGCTVPGCHADHPDIDGRDHPPCSPCKGSGLSRRNTYRHRLDEVGATVATGSAAVLGWKSLSERRRYQRLHARILEACAWTLRPYGKLLLNVSNHIADGDEVRVVEWYLEHLIRAGDDGPMWALDAVLPIETRRNRQGANGDARADHEFLLCLHRRF